MEIDLYLVQLLSPSNRINTGRCWSSTVLRTVDIVGVTYQNSTHRMCQPIKCKTLKNVNIVGVAYIHTRPPRRMCWSIECKTLKTVVIKWKFNCWFHVWIEYIYIRKCALDLLSIFSVIFLFFWTVVQRLTVWSFYDLTFKTIMIQCT